MWTITFGRLCCATLGFAAALAACDRRSAGTKDSLNAEGQLRGCPVAATQDGSPTERAVRCAEAFIARNGYTDVPVLDTSRLASESIEFEPRAAWPRERHGSLVAHAAVVCHYGKREPGYTVGFAHSGDTTRRLGRAVTMNSTFGELRVEHEEFMLKHALADTAHCSQMADRAGGAS